MHIEDNNTNRANVLYEQFQMLFNTNERSNQFRLLSVQLWSNGIPSEHAFKTDAIV